MRTIHSVISSREAARDLVFKVGISRPAGLEMTGVSRRDVRAFSLPELMTVVAIIALMVAAIGVGAARYRQDSEDVRTQGELTSIYKAMEAYRQVYGRYPANYGQLREFISIPDFDNRYQINSNP